MTIFFSVFSFQQALYIVNFKQGMAGTQFVEKNLFVVAVGSRIWNDGGTFAPSDVHRQVEVHIHICIFSGLLSVHIVIAYGTCNNPTVDWGLGVSL